MTSHNLDRVLAMSCRIAILREGRVVYEEDLKSSPSADGVKEAYAWHAGESM
jgi:ABC-type multidrug transport system ATPase subunit